MAIKLYEDKKELQKLLNEGLATGADFSEIFFENSNSRGIQCFNGKVNDVNSYNGYGVSVRLIKGGKIVFGYTNKMEDVEKLVVSLAKSFKDERQFSALELKEVEKTQICTIKIPYSKVSNKEIIEKLDESYKGAKTEGAEVSKVISRFNVVSKNIWVCNSKGIYATDVRANARFTISCVAGNGNDMQTGYKDAGCNAGYEYFDNVNCYELGKNAAKQAVAMYHAEYIKGGKMTVVINNGFGGVILHEACVHSLEATSVAKGASVFCGKIGEKIASDIVNAVDDGTIPNSWGSYNVDDEGHLPKRNVLIKNGVLQSYLVDYANSKKMNHPTTGSGRRQSYSYAPTSRMTNTFFLNGTSTFDEIIKNTKKGLFAAAMGGGSVDPSTGEFNFAVLEGYLIEDGKITKPIKGATLIGSGKDILLNVDMIANNLLTDHGMCGSLSGSVPTDVGQPTIRVQNITVGGRN